MSYAFDGRVVTVPVPAGQVALVMRDRLDAHIVAHTQAEIMDGIGVKSMLQGPDSVTVETDEGQRIHARYLIGADGATSQVARAVGLRKASHFMAALGSEVDAPRDVLRRFGERATFIFGPAPRGYLWIFGKGDHLSVGIMSRAPRPGKLSPTLKRVMERFGLPLDRVPLHGHPIPLRRWHEPVLSGRVLLAGDAAGLADPLSGEGIRYAIKSGRLAAGAILAGTPAQYQRAIDGGIGRNHLGAGAAAAGFYRLPRLCLVLGGSNPFTTEAILDLLADQVGTFEVVWRGMRTLPLFLAVEAAARLAGRLGGRDHARRVRAAVYPWSDVE